MRGLKSVSRTIRFAPLLCLLLTGCFLWESPRANPRFSRDIFTKFHTAEGGFVFQAYEGREAVDNGTDMQMAWLRTWIEDKAICPDGYTLSPRRIDKHNENIVIVTYEGRCK